MRRGEIPALTGLRGVAALLVLINHYAVWCAPFKWSTAPPLIVGVASTSDFGMTLFFTLSGFVITYNYAALDWLYRPVGSFLDFAWRRISRLGPGLLLFCIVIALSTPQSAELPFKLWALLSVPSVQTWYPFKIGGVLASDSYFHVSWSISTEFMMYWMFAIAAVVLAAARHRAWTLIALALVAITAIVLASGAYFVPLPPVTDQLTDAERARWFFDLSPWWRILNFAFGAAAALAVMRRLSIPRGLLSVALVAVAAIYVGHIFGFSLSATMTQVVTAASFAVLMAVSTEATAVNTILGVRPLMFVGEISYSLYLFHFLAPRLIHNMNVEPFTAGALPLYALQFVAALLLALAIAAGLFRIVEQPAQSFLRRMGHPQNGRHQSFRLPKIQANPRCLRGGAPG